MKIVDDAEAIGRAAEDVRRAGYARSALENPLIKEYFILSKAAMFERMGKTEFKDTELREQIYMEMKQLDRFQVNFEKAIKRGKESEGWLQRLANKSKNIMKR